MKNIALLIIYLYLSFPGTAGDFLSQSCLAPKNNNFALDFLPDLNEVPADAVPVKVKVQSQTESRDKTDTIVLLSFKYQRPGLFYDIFSAISSEDQVKKKQGNIKWHEMRKSIDGFEFRLSFLSESIEDSEAIISRLKSIKDYKNNNYDNLKGIGKFRAVLDIKMPDEKGALKKIALFLKKNAINTARFMTPNTENGVTSILMEVSIFKILDMPVLRKLLGLFLEENPDIEIDFRPGKVTDILLDDSLMPIIRASLENDATFNSDELKYQDRIKIIRNSLYKALSIVADKHLSEIRKDLKNSYLTHQVDIINILTKELNFLNIDFIKTINLQLNIQSLSKTVSLLIQLAILHDALEDGDISPKKLKQLFGSEISQIVNILTNFKVKGTMQEEEDYLKGILFADEIQRVIAQAIKIADRIQNMRTLGSNSMTFKRRGFFKTWTKFIPEFLNKIDENEISNPVLSKTIIAAKEKFMQELYKIGRKYNFLDENNNINGKQLRQYLKETEIIDMIKTSPDKRISFYEYMDNVLYKPGGFYAEEVEIGHGASFDTYAENPYFAHCMAKQLIEMYNVMGRPKKFSIIEMGAGSGTLSVNILNAIQLYDKKLFKALEYVFVEISPKLIRDQQQKISAAFGSLKKSPAKWIEGSAATDLNKLKKVQGVFISNELVDQFSVHRIRFTKGQAREVYVKFENGRFIEELGPLSTKDLADYVNNMEETFPDGTEIPVNILMQKWQEGISGSLKKGFVMTLDYGSKTKAVANSRPYAVWNKDTNDINEIYDDTAGCDITSDVNFFHLAESGRKNNLKVEGYNFQRDFLWNLGVEEILIEGREISDRLSYDIATNFSFKAMVQSKGINDCPVLQGFSEDHKPYRYFQNKDIYMVLPVKASDSEYLLFTDTSNDIQSSVFEGGRSALLDWIYKNDSGYQPFKLKSAINTPSFTDNEGNAAVNIKPENLRRTKIYGRDGKLLFDGSEISTENIRDELKVLFNDNDFRDEFSKIIDLTTDQIPRIPTILKLTEANELVTYSGIKHYYSDNPFAINDLGNFKKISFAA